MYLAYAPHQNFTTCVNHTHSLSSDGVDYSTPTTRYVFSADDERQCVDVIIRDDLVFEQTEEFTGRLQGFVIDGRNEATVEGVTLEPANTRVEIQDNDGI